MKLFDAVRNVFNQYATFSGRARRAEYWYFAVFNFVVGSILAALAKNSSFFGTVVSIYEIAVFVPSLAVTWRRLHDIGQSGTNYLWILLPLVGWIILLVKLARAGEPGPNRFGPDPKGEVSFGRDSGETPPWEH